MVTFLADENFNNRILRGMQHIVPEIDFIRVQDTAFYKAHDKAILAFALSENRALLTHDIKTIPKFCEQNLEGGISNPAVFVVKESMPIGEAIEDLVMVAVCSDLEEWLGTLYVLPL